MGGLRVETAGAFRAVRRRGELLKEFDARGGHMKNEGALISQKQAVDAAGISEYQRPQAVRFANVPASNFEAAIEGEDPATVAALAVMGTNWGRLGTATTGFEDRYEAIKLP
jgi:hypothetical protein